MSKIIAYFVRQSLFGNLLTIAVIGLGFISIFLIKREVFPNVNFDIITVSTSFPGASPEEVEKLITNPIEQDLKEVDGIKRLQSVSTESLSMIMIWLDPDQTDDVTAKSDVQDVIDRLKPDFPLDAKDPVVVSVQSKQSPIMEVSLAGDIPPMELRNLARELEREIEDVPGVARVVHRGLRELEIRVEADPKKLTLYRISLDDIVAALRRQNISIPGGVVEAPPAHLKGAERIVRTTGEFKDLANVRGTVVRANELGNPVKVGDVAKVYYDLERATILTKTNGKPSLNLTVLKKEKADAIDLVDNIKKKIDEIQPGFDKRASFSFINDFSQYIRRRLSILTSNLMIGLGMVILMLPLLIPFRFSLIIALGEPFAFLGTILLLHNFGSSINLISMLGLIIVSGILVDDSIVVTENAVRMVEEGVDPKDAAVRGTREILAPLVGSVLTTASAFLPMAFMSGIFGKFVREIPIAVLTALGVSLFETLFILPGHVAHWIRTEQYGPNAKKVENPSALRRFINRNRQAWDQNVVPAYIKWLKLSVRHRYRVMALFVMVFVGSIFLAAKGMRFILFPPEGVEIFFIRTKAPVGTSLDRHMHLLKPIEDQVAQLPKEELDDFTTTVGIQQQDPNDPNTQRGSEYAQIAVYLTPENQRNRVAAAIIEDLRAKVKLPPGLETMTFNRLNPGPPVGKPVSLGVRGKDYDEILRAVADLKAILVKIPGVTDLGDNYNMGKEEVHVDVNSSEAAAAGLSVASIGNTVRAGFEGLIASTVRELDQEIDVRVSLPRSERTQESSLTEILIPNPQGALVPLTSVAKLSKAQTLSTYEHEDNQRQVKVTAEVDTKLTSATEVNNKIRNLLPEIRKKHPKVSVDFGGEDEDTQESMASLARAFGVAILGIFLIQVLIFKSLLQPLVILLTVPLGIIAVIWAFFLHGMPLSFMGMLGIVALAGVIVNNAIVLVAFVNDRRAEGMDRFASIEDAARTRLRPIFLTTVTTVVGILPTAYGIGGLDKFVVPIAMALGWGLMFGSILTAFVFPAALSILDDFQAWTRKVGMRRTAA